MTRRRNALARSGWADFIAGEGAFPGLDEVVAGGDGAAEQRERVGRLVERLVRIPSVRLLDEPDLVGPERLAVRLLGVLAVRAAEADVGPDRDQARPVVGPGLLDRRRDRLHVVAVLDPRRVPAVGLEPGDDVLGPGHRGRPVELDVVVVVQGDELAQAEMAGEARRLRRDPLLEVAVGAEGVRPVVDDVMAVAVELGPEARLGDRHPDRVREALAERAGRRLDARGQAVLGVAGRPGAPLAERLQVLERHVVAGQVEEGVQEHRGVAGRQDEAVAVRPVRVGRGVPEEPRPEGVGHRRRAHRGARMAGVRLLDAIDREGPDRVDREAVEGLGGGRHGVVLPRVRMGPVRCSLRRADCRGATAEAGSGGGSDGNVAESDRRAILAPCPRRSPAAAVRAPRSARARRGSSCSAT